MFSQENPTKLHEMARLQVKNLQCLYVVGPSEWLPKLTGKEIWMGKSKDPLYSQFWSSSCVGALKLRNCRRVQGQQYRPAAPSAPDCTWSKPTASSEQNHLWYHGEVRCENHHSWARRKGTPNPNDKLPPKVNDGMNRQSPTGYTNRHFLK